MKRQLEICANRTKCNKIRTLTHVTQAKLIPEVFSTKSDVFLFNKHYGGSISGNAKRQLVICANRTKRNKMTKLTHMTPGSGDKNIPEAVLQIHLVEVDRIDVE